MNWKPQPRTTDRWRFRGDRPKIGIRPTIDARLGGVRESLEDKTLAMARAAAELIQGALSIRTVRRSSASSPTVRSVASRSPRRVRPSSSVAGSARR